MTEWRSIQGYPDYEVSDEGQIKRVRPWRGVATRPVPYILKPTPNSDGYPVVKMPAGGSKQKKFAIHRLVALTFIGPCPNNMQVRHLDGDKTNARLSNLSYGTQGQNEADKKLHGTFRHRHKLGKDDIEKIISLRRSGMFYWQIAKMFSVHETTILHACRNGHLRRF